MRNYNIMKKIWNQCITLVKQILLHTYNNKSRILKVINVLAQIGTMLAAIVALFALKEAMLQRESMYKPELRIGESAFCADISNIDDIVYYKINNGSIDLSNRKRNAWFRVDNIGIGSALSVSIKACFNRAQISPLLAKEEKGINEDNIENCIMDTIIHENDSLILFNGDVTRRWRIDYVLPISQKGEECCQEFSQTGFKTLIKIFLWLKKTRQFDDSYEFLIPTELKYKDINGKQYQKEFEMFFRFAFVDGDNTKIVCLIKSGQPYKEDYEEFKDEVDEEDVIKVYKTY